MLRQKLATWWKAVTGALLLAGLIAACGEVHAWGDDGHRIVGEIAWRNLTEPAARRVRVLLQADEETYRTLAGAALWADRVKNEADRTWHYVNLPSNAAAAQIEEACRRPRWCVTAAVVHFHEVLCGESHDSIRRDALKYLAHFVGDLHQPLHAASRDAGGNTRQVSFFGRKQRAETGPYNLHAVWDRAILDREIHRKGTDWRRYAHQLAAAVTPEQRRAWSGAGPESWTLESSELAYSRVYPAPDNVSGEYYEAAVCLIEEQLQRAGIRLAGLLNDALR